MQLHDCINDKHKTIEFFFNQVQFQVYLAWLHNEFYFAKNKSEFQFLRLYFYFRR